MKTRLALFVAATATIAAGAAGCSAPPAPSPGSSAPAGAISASPAAMLAQAAQSTESAGSAKVTSTTTVDSGAGGQDMTVRGGGVVDFASGEASMRLSSSLFGGGMDLEVIVADGKSYIKVPMFGDKWLETPLQDLGVTFADPAAGLDMLKEVGDLKEVGPENVAGVPATKYTGTVDLHKLMEQTGAAQGDSSQAKQLAKLTGVADVTVWVDGDGRIVRYDQKADLKAGGQSLVTTMSTTFTDFGVDTAITPPPTDQVMTADQLKKLGDLAGQVD